MKGGGGGGLGIPTTHLKTNSIILAIFFFLPRSVQTLERRWLVQRLEKARSFCERKLTRKNRSSALSIKLRKNTRI